MANPRRPSAALVAAALAWCVAARAQELEEDVYPVELVERPLTFPAGVGEVDLLAVTDLSAGHLADALVVVPALAFGLTDAVQLAVFSPAGFCVALPGSGCPRVFDGLGAELTVALTRGAKSEVAVHGTVASLLHDTARAAANVGARAKLRREGVALVIDGSLQGGLSDRDAQNPDLVAFSAEVLVQLERELALGLDTSIVTTLGNRFGNTTVIPVGLSLTYTPVPRVDLGARFSFENLLGDRASADARLGRVVLALRL